MMKPSSIAFLAVAIAGVTGQRFGDFGDRGSPPSLGGGFDRGFPPGLNRRFGHGFPFFPPPIFRFGNPIDSIFCRSIKNDSEYRLTISTRGSNKIFNVSGESLIDCLSEEGKRCSVSVIFDDEFLGCVEEASGGGSNSTEPTTISSVTGSGSEDTTLRVSTVSSMEDTSNASSAPESPSTPVEPELTSAQTDATPGPDESVATSEEISTTIPASETP